MTQDKLIGIINLVRGITDENIFIINEEVTFESSRLNLSITLLPGFVTDGISVPKFIWSFIDPWSGKYLIAAIFHDLLYSTHIMSKNNSDLVFLDILTYCNVNKTTSKLMYYAVKYFGQKYWDAVSDIDFSFIKIKNIM